MAYRASSQLFGQATPGAFAFSGDRRRDDPRQRNRFVKWFRFYSDALHHPKTQRLSPVLFKHWVNLLCLVAAEDSQGEIPSADDVAYHLGVTIKKADDIFMDLALAGLIDATDAPRLFIHNWGERQPRSDNAAERMRQTRRTSSEHVQDDAEHVPPRVEKSREDQSREEEKRVDADASAAPTSVPVLSVLTEEPVLTNSDFEELRTHWKTKIGALTTDQSRCLREHYGGHPSWAWAAVNETIAAPTPSWAYYLAIIGRCMEQDKPPSSLAKAGAR